LVYITLIGDYLWNEIDRPLERFRPIRANHFNPNSQFPLAGISAVMPTEPLNVAAVLEHCDLALARHHVAVHEKAVVEAFPSSFLGVMIEAPKALNARRSDRSDIFFQFLAGAEVLQRLIAYCLPGRLMSQHPSAVTNHDDRAALVCALTALCVAARDYTAAGDEDGWIILPPSSFVQGWAMDALRANAAGERGPALHIETGEHGSSYVDA